MASGYREIKFWRFALAGLVVSAPVVVLEQSGKEGWAWAYVSLVLLAAVVFYSAPLSTAMAYTSAQLRKG